MEDFRFISSKSDRLDKVLSENYPDHSRSFFQKLICSGSAHVNNVIIVKPKHILLEGDNIHVNIPKKPSKTIKPISVDLDVVYEDDFLAVINKPIGIVTHPGVGNKEGTLVDILQSYFGHNLSSISGRPGIVHRLDKDTSGLMIIAKNDQAHYRLSSMIEKKEVQRIYHAFSWGVPSWKEEVIDANIIRSKTDHKKMKVTNRKDIGKKAITHVRMIERYSTIASLFECQLHTGRTHQIRAHLSYKGHSIIGDQIYGKNNKKIEDNISLPYQEKFFSLKRQALHSSKLFFSSSIYGSKDQSRSQYSCRYDRIKNSTYGDFAKELTEEEKFLG